jgi:hypothetical protein
MVRAASVFSLSVPLVAAPATQPPYLHVRYCLLLADKRSFKARKI